jgi:hypothetical protein
VPSVLNNLLCTFHFHGTSSIQHLLRQVQRMTP